MGSPMPIVTLVFVPEQTSSSLANPDHGAIHPKGSSTTHVPGGESEHWTESTPPLPPVKREVVVALRAPDAAPVTVSGGRKRSCHVPGASKKRKCARKVEVGPSPLGALSSGTMSQHRTKVCLDTSSLSFPHSFRFVQLVSLIDGILGDCGSEVERLTVELPKSNKKSSLLKAKLGAIKGFRSLQVSQLEAQISRLERDLRKTASSLLKEKKARKAKARELRHLQRQLQTMDYITRFNAL